MIKESIGLSYDDVLLVPNRTSVNSRKDINLKTELTKNLVMNMPIMSANMDTITEWRMAEEIAPQGDGKRVGHVVLNVSTYSRFGTVHVSSPLS